jgi:hypothetical protein
MSIASLARPWWHRLPFDGHCMLMGLRTLTSARTLWRKHQYTTVWGPPVI